MLKNILIVDDDHGILKYLPKTFDKFFKEKHVDTAWSFPRALELLKEKVYHIVLLDGGLSERITDPPEHGLGFYLIPEIKLVCPKAVIIMISGDKQYCDIGLEMGADYAFPKKLFFKEGKVLNSLGFDENNKFFVEKGL